MEVSQKYRFKQKPTENSVPTLLLNQIKYFKILVTLAIWNKILKSVTGRQKNNTLTSEILQAVKFTFTVTVKSFMLLMRLYVCSTGPASQLCRCFFLQQDRTDEIAAGCLGDRLRSSSGEHWWRHPHPERCVKVSLVRSCDVFIFGLWFILITKN